MLRLFRIGNHSSPVAFTEFNRVCVAFLNGKISSDVEESSSKPTPIKNQSLSYEEIIQINNTKTNGRYNDVYKDMVQLQQGSEHEFAAGREKDILERIEHMDQSSIDRQTCAANLSEGSEECEVNMDIHKHDHSANVSLYSVMQSNVPEPYSPNKTPTHMNMPRGGAMMRQKYVSGQEIEYHQSRRRYTTSAAMFNFTHGAQPTSMQGAQPNNYSNPNLDNDSMTTIQGVQGDDCVRYKIWLENCNRFNLDCDEQIQQTQTGKKTLSEVFAEQDRLIHQIAMDYQVRKSMEHIKEMEATPEGVQGSQQDIVNQLQGKTLEDLLHSETTPQGVQGMNCDHFNIWLENCTKYGFVNCDEQLRSIQTGKKTLAQVFAEQDRIIKEIAHQYSTNAVNSSDPNDDGDKRTVVKLSQKDRLKKAVKEYGATVVVFHIGISLMSLGGFYLAVSSGLDVVGILGKIGVGQSILESRLATGASTFVVAYAVHKVFAPVRIGITLTSTPFIVRYLRKVGFLKTPKPKV